MKKKPNSSKLIKTNIKKTANFFYEIGSLRKIARAHRQPLLEDDLSDNIASHSYRVTMIGLFLAKLEKADANKVVMMCLFHDAAEARSNDHNWVHKKYVKIYEDEISRDQLSGLPGAEDFNPVIHEYGERKTHEARIAKDADLLDQVLLLKEYAHRGNKEAAEWLVGKRDGKHYFTASAKALAKEIIDQEPSEWWKGIWTNVNR